MSTHAKTLIFVIGALLGIYIGEVSMRASEIGVLVGVLFIVQTVIYMWERKRKMMGDADGIVHHFSFPLIILLLSAGLFIGIVRVQFVEEKNIFVCEKSCTFDAVIVSSPEAKNEYQTFSVRPVVDNDEVYDIAIRTSLYPRYRTGDTILLSGKVVIPKNIYPHNSDRTSSKSFDYVSYLHTRNIGSEMLYPKVEVVDDEAHTIRSALGRIKEQMMSKISLYVSAPASSIASGMLFGATSMSKELLETFRVAGLSHIVVLSGFNIVIVISSVLFVFGFLPLLMRIIVASSCVVLFVIMVGGEMSVIRATLMAFISLLAMLSGHLYVARQALVVSLFCIVMYEPYSLLHDASLHLSFLATAGIVYMTSPLDKMITKYIVSKKFYIKEIIITTISAYLATLPYVMYAFGKMSLYAIVTNILVVPFVPLAMLFSFLVVLCSYISHTLSLGIGFLDTALISYMIAVADFFESAPFSSITVSTSMLMMFCMYLLLGGAVYYFVMKQYDETDVTKKDGIIEDIIRY